MQMTFHLSLIARGCEVALLEPSVGLLLGIQQSNNSNGVWNHTWGGLIEPKDGLWFVREG